MVSAPLPLCRKEVGSLCWFIFSSSCLEQTYRLELPSEVQRCFVLVQGKITQTVFLAERASLLPVRECRESCPDCCLWSETQSQTCVMGMSSCCCSGCCLPQCHPVKNRHHLSIRNIFVNIIHVLHSYLKHVDLPFLSLFKVTTLGLLIEISIRGGLISAIFISSSSSESSSESWQ